MSTQIPTDEVSRRRSIWWVRSITIPQWGWTAISIEPCGESRPVLVVHVEAFVVPVGAADRGSGTEDHDRRSDRGERRGGALHVGELVGEQFGAVKDRRYESRDHLEVVAAEQIVQL